MICCCRRFVMSVVVHFEDPGSRRAARDGAGPRFTFGHSSAGTRNAKNISRRDPTNRPPPDTVIRWVSFLGSGPA